MSKKLAIVHVVRSPVGGIYRHIADLAVGQQRAGHSVGLICDSTTGGALEDERLAALAPGLALGLVRLPMPRAIGPGDLAATIAVTRHIARMRADVIHAHGAKGGVYARLAGSLERRRGRRVATFYAPHGGSLHYERESAAGRIYFTIERALERATDGLIHVSAYEAEVYRRKVGAPRCPAHVVVNGLKPEEFEPVEAAGDPVDFLYIGMLRDLKGIDVFLAALRLLAARQQRPSALVVGAGESADERRYHAMVADAGLAGQVTFLAPMPARQAFARARTIVVPSRAESMPYIVLEAAAAAAPMIATNVGGIPEIMSGEGERLVPPGDPESLADAMQLALRAPEQMAADARLRRERVRQKFSLATMVGRVEDIYRGSLEPYRERQVSPVIKADLAG